MLIPHSTALKLALMPYSQRAVTLHGSEDLLAGTSNADSVAGFSIVITSVRHRNEKAK